MKLREPRVISLFSLFLILCWLPGAAEERSSEEPAPATGPSVGDDADPGPPPPVVEVEEEEGPDLDEIVPQPGDPGDPGELLPQDEEMDGVDLGELPPAEAPVPASASGSVKKSQVLTLDENFKPTALRGINLIQDRRKRIGDTFLPEITPVGGVVAAGGLADPPEFESLRQELTSEYLGKPLNFGGLEEIVKKIQNHYLSNGRMLTHVFVPNQVMSDKLVIAVLEGRVTSLDAEASIPDNRSWWDRWYDQPYSLESLVNEVQGELGGLDALEPQALNDILVDLNISPWARLERPIQHPFRQVQAKYGPVADLIGETEVTLLVEQQRPLRFFGGFDNTLTQNLGEERVYFGAVWYDAFALNLDHQFAFQLFYGLQSDSLEGFAMNYIIPWKMWDGKHSTELYFAYTQSTAPTTIGGLPANVTGDSTIGGFRHYYELPPIVDGGKIVRGDRLQYELDGRLPWMSARKKDRQTFGIFHEVGGGLDFKRTNNDLEFGGFSVAPAEADIIQLVLEYNARQTDGMGETNLSWRNFVNIGGSGDAELQAIRAGAESSYWYTRADLEREQDLPWGTFARARLTGQYSTTNLLQSEQLGVGGFTSVRGYPERVFRADTGWLFSLEYYSPAFHPLARVWPSLGKRDELRFLVFTDWGGGAPSEDIPTDPFDDSTVLGSVGLGLRYDVGANFRLRLDYGIQLSSLDAAFPAEASDNQLHFGIVATF